MLLTTSCKRSTSGPGNEDDNGGYAADASKIELISNDVISMADVAGTFYGSDYIGSGVTVATDTVSVPHTLIIRFGDKDLICLDGKARSGSIVISYSGEYTDTAQLHTITFDNYTINDNSLTGSVAYTRVDTTVAGNWYYKVKVAETLTVQPNTATSQTIIWGGSLVRKWVQGYNTGDRSDDIFSISGSANLTRYNGNLFGFNISAPIQFALACDYAEAGVVDVASYQGGRILDYGDGTCDDKAKVTIDVNSYNVLLDK